MSNNIYHHEELYRGSTLMATLAEKHIAVCGAGAIGSNLMDGLCRQGFTTFTIVDFDRVESHNINNQIYTSDDVGSLKVNAVRDHCYLVNEATVGCITKKLDQSNVKKLIPANSDLVVDAFDNFESRRVLRDYCLGRNLPCVHAGINATYGEVVWNEKYKIPEVEIDDKVPACDVPLARNVVVIIVAIAAELIIRFFAKNEKASINFSLGDFRTNTL